MCIDKHCFLPMLLVFAMKCCTKMPCPLPHNHYCCLLPSPVVCLPPWTLAHLYMPHLFTHCLPTIICVTLMSIVFFIFAIGYATFICDSILACLWTYFLFRFYFCVIPCDCYNFVLSPSPLFFHAIYVSDLIPLPQFFDGVGMMKHVCVFVEKFAPNNSCHSTSSFLLPPN